MSDSVKLVAILGTAAALAACGSSGQRPPAGLPPGRPGGLTTTAAPPQPTVASARVTVKRFIADLLDSRAADACELMTPAGQAQVGGGNALECAPHLLLARQLTSTSKLNAALKHADTMPIKITGNTASAPPMNANGHPTPLVWQGGRWLIGPSP